MTVTPDSVRILLASTDYGDRLRGVNQLRELEPAIAFELIGDVLQDSNTRVRYAAVSMLDSIGSADLTKSLEILRACLHDSEYDVQAAAADAIGGLQITSAIPELIELYHSTPEWLLKMSIVAALGNMNDPQVFPLMATAIQSETELVRMTAVQALGELADPQGVEILAPYRQDPDTQIRFRVAEALGRIGGEAAQTLLKTMTEDGETLVAEQAKAFII